MRQQQRASEVLFRTWQFGLAILMISALAAWCAWLWHAHYPVPDELVKRGLVDSINQIRMKWMMGQRGEYINWQARDGSWSRIKVSAELGWPQPEGDCRNFWIKVMGRPAEDLITNAIWHSSPNELCEFRLSSSNVLGYYAATGSILLQEQIKTTVVSSFKNSNL